MGLIVSITQKTQQHTQGNNELLCEVFFELFLEFGTFALGMALGGNLAWLPEGRLSAPWEPEDLTLPLLCLEMLLARLTLRRWS